MTTKEIIKAIGGPVAVGRRMGIRSQAVSLWIRANRIPAERVPTLEAMCKELGLPVRAEDMRPDIEWGALRG
jgi:DNA-binding transcriptional regulator YdaS (Cro superfamily)